MRARVKTLVVTACAIAAVLGGGVAPAQAAPQRLSIIAMPHPDDESMAASQFQSASDNYQVFVTFTRGEQTGNCIPSNYAATYNPELGELPASNAPVQQFQPSCENSRLDGLRNFLTQMGPAVPSLPSSFGAASNHTLPANGAALCRFDGNTTCLNAQGVRVWHDSGGRGSIVAFNLGDGDLTSAEVVWAINGLMQNRTTLLPDATDAYPLYNIIGPYWYNGSDPACEPYPNADHRAVHVALWATSFGAVYNSAATCASDPDRTVLATVNDAYWNAAFTAQTGAFHRHYGWLWPGSWQTDRNGQGEWFHGAQAFWRRF